MLFFPTKFPDGDWKPKELQYEDVWFASGMRNKIHGWFCPCDEPVAFLLYMHGNAGNITHRADLLLRLQRQIRVSVLIFDYRGYGRSSGFSTIFSVLKDARAAAQYLAERAGVSENELIFMGRSLGGAVAIQLSAKMQPRGLIVASSFLSLKHIAAHHYSSLSWLVPRTILNSETSIRNYTGNLLLSHGKNDFTIPYDNLTHFIASLETKNGK